MKKIIPFKKEVLFKTNVSEILSIALDKELNVSDNQIKGSFRLYGEYNDFEDNKPFNIEIPYSSYLDEPYNTKNATIDIDDFYYEILDDKKLVINIDIKVDNLEEADLLEREEDVNDIFEYNNPINEAYMTYRVYIVRENDTVDSIALKYQISKEILAHYNALNNISVGDKIIIPNENNK